MTIKKPSDCTKEELEGFKNLVLAGGQVTANGLETRIKNCKVLGFYYVDNRLVGVSAIKQKDKEIVKRTRNKAKVKTDGIPTLELGYSFTNPDFRGQGINKKLNDGLLKVIVSEKIYATTDNDTMRKYLTDNGFKKAGESFKGNYNENLDYFER
jgi:hypothetical protein